MTPAYVELVARMAYLWGWPLVSNLNRSMAMKDWPEPGRIGGVVPASPPGYISMLTDYIDAAEKFVTCPNQDTVYGAGYQRLDSKPGWSCYPTGHDFMGNITVRWEHLFEPNALNRFSLGTKSKSLKHNDDGSLTPYFQNASPGADKESNWVPAPKDDFSLYIRAYWPKPEILEEKWTPPSVKRVSE